MGDEQPALLPRIVTIPFTFHIVVVGWIFFRAASFADAEAYLGGILRGDG